MLKEFRGGDGPVAMAARSGVTVVVEDPSKESNFKRRELAKEFNIGSCHFVPCRDGVLEYGTGLSKWARRGRSTLLIARTAAWSFLAWRRSNSDWQDLEPLRVAVHGTSFQPGKSRVDICCSSFSL